TPAGTITPGSGTQQNSQCVLSGAGSSVIASGITLTVNVSLAFQPSFTGSKNVYMEAANPFQAATWQLQGVWVVPSAITVAVTPSSGNASQQTFNLQVTDPADVADLTNVGLLFINTTSTTGACAVIYNLAQTTLSLLDADGTAPGSSITPGSGSQQNNQCILNGAGSSV